MIETQMENRVFEDLSGAEGTTLKDLLIKYRDEVVPTLKSKTTLTYKINYTLKFKVCYFNLLELNTSHINNFTASWKNEKILLLIKKWKI